MTSSVAGIGPAPPGEVGTEDDFYRGGGLGLAYPDAKHEGEAEALAAGARHGVEVVIVNPSYVFGVPVDRSAPGETSTRMIGSYLRGRLPAVVDGETNVVDVRDVAKGHLLAAERGTPGERYVLGGHDIGWVELFERVAELSGVRHPLLVLPREAGGAGARGRGRRASEPDLARGTRADGAELALLVRARRAASSATARAALERTLADTIDWYRELIESGALGGGRPSALSLAAAGMRVAERTGALARAACGRALRRAQDGGAVSVSSGLFPRDEYFMRLALREAERALEHDDVPIGAVIVHEGEVIARRPQRARAAPRPDGARRDARAARGVPAAGELAAARHGALRDARAVRDVRRRDRPRARPAGGLRGRRSQGRSGRKRAQRARRAAAEPPPRGRPAACSLRRPPDCCVHFSLPGDRSAAFLPIRTAMSVDPKAILQRIESTYGPLAEGVPSVAYVYEPGVNGQCLYISPSIERVLGFSQESWIEDGGLWDRLLHPEDAERVISNEAECASSGEALVQEYRISRADGRVVWIRDEMTVVRGADGQDAAAASTESSST